MEWLSQVNVMCMCICMFVQYVRDKGDNRIYVCNKVVWLPHGFTTMTVHLSCRVRCSDTDPNSCLNIDAML